MFYLHNIVYSIFIINENQLFYFIDCQCKLILVLLLLIYEIKSIKKFLNIFSYNVKITKAIDMHVFDKYICKLLK